MISRTFLQSSLLKEMVILNIELGAPEEQTKSACIAMIPVHLRTLDLEVFDEADESDEGPGGEHDPPPQGNNHGTSRRLHISAHRRVAVKVRYAGRAEEHHFSPAATIKRVRHWAIRKFQIAEHDATELVLQLAGSDLQPPADRHVGCYINGEGKVTFDLVRGYTVNGDTSLPSEQSVREHLRSAAYLSGEDAGKWKLQEIRWPYVLLDTISPRGEIFTLRLNCDSYPSLPPTGAFWDVSADAPLPAAHWPSSAARWGRALRTDWQNGLALYIPCDRHGIAAHDQWAQLYPSWIWDPKIGLTRYLTVVTLLLGWA